jgi:hypothetical protein
MNTCSKCGLAVIILPDATVIKACKCEAPIIASIGSGIKSSGGIKTK